MTTTDAADQELSEEASRTKKKVIVQVNSQDVSIHRGERTGHRIKEVAVEQGVAIQLGFVLSVKRGDRYDIIGDADTVKVHAGMDFVAVAPDDNS
jgi:Multiubiquitin